MSKRNLQISFFASLFFLTCTFAVSAQAPDNTANNKQPQVTADQQSDDAADRAITRKIRKALIADKSLSTYAHNVKIIASDGRVTLRGPVESEEEKQKVASEAGEVVDANQIDNQLTVKDH